jgi:hypothetical protein
MITSSHAKLEAQRHRFWDLLNRADYRYGLYGAVVCMVVCIIRYADNAQLRPSLLHLVQGHVICRHGPIRGQNAALLPAPARADALDDGLMVASCSSRVALGSISGPQLVVCCVCSSMPAAAADAVRGPSARLRNLRAVPYSVGWYYVLEPWSFAKAPEHLVAVDHVVHRHLVVGESVVVWLALQPALHGEVGELASVG